MEKAFKCSHYIKKAHLHFGISLNTKEHATHLVFKQSGVSPHEFINSYVNIKC